MWNYWVLSLLVVLIAILWIRYKVEYFQDEEPHYQGYNATLQTTNLSTQLVDRHPMDTTILTDMKAKNEKAYNYELENKAYEEMLFKTFAISRTCLQDQDWGVVEPNNRVIPPTVTDAYEQAIRVLADKLRVIGQPKIQIVHDRLISYRRHKRFVSVWMEIQTLLYREAKYHGKDVTFTVLADKNKGFWNIRILDAKVNGVVFEDKIALFPVQGNDELVTNQDLSTPMFPEPRFASFDDDVQFYEYCASTNLDENKRMACVDVIQNSR